MEFYEKVKALCARERFDISYIGDHIGVPINSSTVSRWKAGAVPRNATVKAIADHFGVSVEYLLGMEEAAKPSAGLSDDALKIALFRGSEGVTDEMLQEVLNFADFVKAREKNKGKS